MKKITLLFLILNFHSFGQSDYKILKKACHLESDSIFDIFIEKWKNNVRVDETINQNDSLQIFQNLISDFYTKQINDYRISSLEPFKFENQYLIFDFRKIKIEYVKSDNQAENLLLEWSKKAYIEKTNLLYPDSNVISLKSALRFFSDRHKWNVTFRNELKNFNCKLNYEKALYLNDSYDEIIKTFIKKRNIFRLGNSKRFFYNRIQHFWIYPDYGTITTIRLFSSGKVAIVSYSKGSICSYEEIYYFENGKWKAIGKADFECISVKNWK